MSKSVILGPIIHMHLGPCPGYGIFRVAVLFICKEFTFNMFNFMTLEGYPWDTPFLPSSGKLRTKKFVTFFSYNG